MKSLKLYTTLMFVLFFTTTQLNAQNAFDAKKPKSNQQNNKKPNIEEFSKNLQIWRKNKAASKLKSRKFKNTFNISDIKPLQINEQSFQSKQPSLTVQLAENGTPFFIKNQASSYQKKLTTESERLQAVYNFLNKEKVDLKVEQPETEFQLNKTQTDKQGNTHFRFKQQYKGIDIWASSIAAHVNNQGVYVVNGRYEITPQSLDTKPNLTEDEALQITMEDLKKHTTVMSKTQSALLQKLVPHFQPVSELNILPKEKTTVLVWKITYSPNIKEHWHYFINAHTGIIEKKYNDVCSFGPETAKADDLYGEERTINTYSLDGDYYLIDASRDNFSLSSSDLPDDPVGAIVTIDLRNNPVDQFGDWVDKLKHVESSNNRWNNPTAVSAHYNAGRSYEYFKNTFGRNSIDGKGGTIWTVINVSDDNGRAFDNAFWNGSAMFYGNGKDAFKDLPKAIDAGAHEMSHGVIQNTANLIYEYQPGALNESFADVFGVMVDRDDWKIGEDVALRSAFPSGAMRDVQNPNNGASRGEVNKGWQPKNMNEYVNTNQDNGGVHINSGIPNRAFYLFATAVGKDKAERVYYHALDNYLTQRSQFVDCRASVIQSSIDLYDNNVAAEAAKAFDGVGIKGEGVAGGSTGGSSTTSSDLPTGEGAEHFWVCDVNDNVSSAVAYDYNFGNDEITRLTDQNAFPKGSVTDDGDIALYVAADNNVYSVDLTATNPLNTIQQITFDNNWRKVAISRDGSLIAALTKEETSGIWIFGPDGYGQEFDLYNPSTANDGSIAGAPEYADAIEFEPNGEYLMYDAYNVISRTGGTEVGSWDIGIIKVWDNDTYNYGDGKILKLFPPQPSHISIGNATFAKNSSYIIAFDRLDENANTLSVMAANLNTGAVKLIEETNDIIGYPTFSPDDDAIAYSDFGEAIINNMRVETYLVEVVKVGSDKISRQGAPETYFSEAAWPVWFRQGKRNWVKPTADFAANVVEGAASLTVNFVDRSNNLPNQWKWTFEEGQPSTSTEQNPVVTFDNPGTYNVTLKVSNPEGEDTETKNNYITVRQPVGIEDTAFIQSLNLNNQPNPFTEETTIAFTLDKPNNVQLEIFDVTGKSLKILLNKQLTDGTHQVIFDASKFAKGVYLYQLSGDGFSVTNRLVKY